MAEVLRVVPIWTSDKIPGLTNNFVPVAMQDYGKYYDCQRYVVMIGRPVYNESPDWNVYIFCYREGTLSVQNTIPIIGSKIGP